MFSPSLIGMIIMTNCFLVVRNKKKRFFGPAPSRRKAGIRESHPENVVSGSPCVCESLLNCRIVLGRFQPPFHFPSDEGLEGKGNHFPDTPNDFIEIKMNILCIKIRINKAVDDVDKNIRSGLHGKLFRFGQPFVNSFFDPKDRWISGLKEKIDSCSQKLSTGSIRSGFVYKSPVSTGRRCA